VDVEALLVVASLPSWIGSAVTFNYISGLMKHRVPFIVTELGRRH
jgi:hypothetical protein